MPSFREALQRRKAFMQTVKKTVFVSRKGSGNEAVPHEEKGARLFQKPKHCAYSRHSPLLPQPQNGCTEGVD
jgi:hypothetical protein